jgi:hypothetical protein
MKKLLALLLCLILCLSLFACNKTEEPTESEETKASETEKETSANNDARPPLDTEPIEYPTEEDIPENIETWVTEYLANDAYLSLLLVPEVKMTVLNVYDWESLKLTYAIACMFTLANGYLTELVFFRWGQDGLVRLPTVGFYRECLKSAMAWEGGKFKVEALTTYGLDYTVVIGRIDGEETLKIFDYEKMTPRDLHNVAEPFFNMKDGRLPTR